MWTFVSNHTFGLCIVQDLEYASDEEETIGDGFESISELFQAIKESSIMKSLVMKVLRTWKAYKTKSSDISREMLASACMRN